MTPGTYTIVVEAKDDNGVVSNLTSKIQFVDTLASRATSLAHNGTIKSTVIVGLRPEPTFQAKPTRNLKNGDKIEVVGKSDRWLKIKIGSAVGYVPDNYIQFAK